MLQQFRKIQKREQGMETVFDESRHVPQLKAASLDLLGTKPHDGDDDLKFRGYEYF